MIDMVPAWVELLSIILNAVLGAGLFVTFVTLRSVKREAVANAKKAEALATGSEIENVDAAVKIWRELAEKMAERQSGLAEQVEELSVEVRRLKNATNRVVRLLDRITPENLSEMVAKIKQEIEDDPKNIADSATCPDVRL